MTNAFPIALPPGSLISHYQVVRVLGQGGFGVVYLAEHQHLHKQVAIKEFFPSMLVGRQGQAVVCQSTQRAAVYEECLRRFKEEGRTLTGLSHPSVVRCLDLFLANGTAYLVMDYEEGESLQTLLERNEALGKYYSERLLLNLLIRIAEGIDYLHRQGVYHRDIKPDNVYIRKSDDSPVLLDFGAAKHSIAKETQSKAPYTEFYAPIEQVSAEGEIKPTMDIHGFGALMYRIVTGAIGSKAETRSMQMVFGKPDPLKPAKESAKGPYSDAFLALIDHCLAFNADNRPQSMAEVLSHLQALAAEEPPAAANASPQPDSTIRPTLTNAPGQQPEQPFEAHAAAASVSSTGTVPWKSNRRLWFGVGATLMLAIVGYNVLNRTGVDEIASPAEEMGTGPQQDEATALVQQWLIRHGYELAITGVLDTRTRATIERYEQEAGLIVTGEADATLLAHLKASYWEKDERDFSTAQDINTKQGYFDYLDKWEDGQFRQQAEQDISRILAEQREAEERAIQEAIATREAEEAARKRAEEIARQEAIAKREAEEQAELEAQQRAKREEAARLEAERRRREEYEEYERIQQEKAQERLTLIFTRFKDNGNGTVTDSRTGLTWSRCAYGQTWLNGTCVGDAVRVSFDDAKSAAKRANISGIRGWKVPNKDQLYSLIDCNSGRRRGLNDRGQGGACEGGRVEDRFPEEVFINFPKGRYWTSSHWTAPLGYGWFVNFDSGGMNWNEVSRRYYVRFYK